MGFLPTKTKTKTQIFGKEETAALQPGLFELYRRLMAMRGTPNAWIHRMPLNRSIDSAYGRALAEAHPDVRGDMGIRRNLDVGNLWAGIGSGAQDAKMGTAGSLGSYIANLTSGRPSQPTFQDNTQQNMALIGSLMQKLGGAGVNAYGMQQSPGGVNPLGPNYLNYPQYWGRGANVPPVGF